MKDKVQNEIGLTMGLDPLVRDVALVLLQDAGFDLALLVEQEGTRARTLSFFYDRKTEADKAEVRLCQLRLKGRVKVFRKEHRQSEWSTRWKEGWRPFALTERFHVVPLWQEDQLVPKGKEPLYLDTTNAFGTGRHETTRFTAEFVEQWASKVDSFLDVGTGTGVLSMVALKCGVEKVVAFDIDPDAVEVARQNLEANRLSCQLTTAGVGGFEPPEAFELVAANLISHDLVAFQKSLVALVAHGGKLILSGISLENLPVVEQAFAKGGLTLLDKKQGQEWAALVYEVERSGK